MTTWEVSWVYDDASRYVIFEEVPTSRLVAATEMVIAGSESVPKPRTPRTPALMLTRTDQTPEALRAAWESEFYDLVTDKNGRVSKRRRYRRTKEEREYEGALKVLRQGKKEVKTDQKSGNLKCKDCGAKWYGRASDYGFVHSCEKGLVREHELLVSDVGGDDRLLRGEPPVGSGSDPGEAEA